MYYEINVSRNGTHLFATASRSIKNGAKANALFKEMKEKFPDDKVTIVFEEHIGRDMTEQFEQHLAEQGE